MRLVGRQRVVRSCSLMVLVIATTACESDARSDADSDTPTTSVSTSTLASTSTSTTSAPSFPPPRLDVEHGGTTWSVVLAGAETFEAPALTAAIRAAKDAGYSTGATDCDSGAKEALGMSSQAKIYTVSVYFDTDAAARRALAAFRAHGFEGGVVAEVRTFCLD